MIGRQLVPLLVAEGHEVVASARSPAKLGEMRAVGAEPVVMDGLDPTSVAEAINATRPEVVVHQMTALAHLSSLRRFDRAFALTNRLRTEGTRNLLQAAAGAGVLCLVAQSFTGWTNDTSGPPLKDETCPFDAQPPRSMRQSLDAIARLEEMVTTATGLEGVVLRYGHLYGPGAPAFLEAVGRRKLPVVGGGAGRWSFTHVLDAAEATVVAIERAEQGLYNIVDDDPPPAAEWIPFLAEAAGAKPPMQVPVWIGRLAAGEAVVSMMTRACGASNAKAKARLGWTPRHASWRDAFGSWASEERDSEGKAAA